MALFKMFKGEAANLPKTYNDGYCYVTIDDGKMYIDTTNEADGRIVLNAAHADTADKLSVDGGDINTPVYFVNGVPTPCTSLDLNTSGNAASATQIQVIKTNPTTGTTYGIPFHSGFNVGGLKIMNLNDGLGYYTKEGTTTAIGIGELKLGNNIAAGTAGNKRGALYMFGTSTGYTELMPSNNTATNIKINLPATSGTLALTSHDHNYLPLSGGTMEGPIIGKVSLASSRLQGTVTGGYHLITINSANAWMTAFTVRLYQGYKWSDVVISGYNYNTNYWYVPSAILMGSSNSAAIDVTFGYTSTYNLWVAIPAANYYGIDIIDCVNGCAAFDSWKDLFTITHVETLPETIQTTITAQRPWYRGESVTGAVWNDYAECRESNCQEAGYVLIENGDDTLSKSIERLSPFAGVSSDTWGFSQGETAKAKTHIAVAGRVLVYTYKDRNEYKPGDCVCAAPDGTVDIMTREEVIQWPDRIVGTVSCVPEYEEWGGGDRDPVKINGRIWIKVK